MSASGGTLHAVADRLGGDPNLASLTPLVTRGAAILEDFAASLSGRDAAVLWRDAGRYAREQPLIATRAAGACRVP